MAGHCCHMDGDSPSVYRSDVVQARKDHICGECGHPIKQGEFYLATFGVWDGEANSYKECGFCASAMELCGYCTHGGEFSEHFNVDIEADFIGKILAVEIHNRLFGDDKRKICAACGEIFDPRWGCEDCAERLDA
ncbi:MAG: hypothetical protein HQL66_03115 [Magnetococcales bacterium]|nr:hypothetical protein [Magnetococcales bacterium]